MGLSGLNAHRKQYHFIDVGSCPNCNFRTENTTHFLLQCPAYAVQRTEMVTTLSHLLPNIQTKMQSSSKRVLSETTTALVQGISDEKSDREIFKCVAKFISDSKRFS